MTRYLPLLLSTALLAACQAPSEHAAPTGRLQAGATVASDPAERRAFFGELHLHTAYSYDAWGMMGARTTPDEAYRFARGEVIDYLGQKVRRAEPLDFVAVTDHSEFIGTLNELQDPGSELSRSELGRRWLSHPMASFLDLNHALATRTPVAGLNAEPAMRSAWQRVIEAANANYRPGTFTTFIGYEWTAMPQGKYNLHRNIIFNSDHAPAPFTSADSERPEDLWTYLEKVRGQGIPVIAIPHNSNASGGLMFDWVNSDGKPIDEAYAQRRALNEPLMEISQTKGQSETVPELSASDEFANFEVMDRLLTAPVKSAPPGSYARDALGRGLLIEGRTGANPYKLGFVGGSDIHNGLSTSAENSFAGGAFGQDPDVTLPGREQARRILSPPKPTDITKGEAPDVLEAPFNVGSAALTGVWAEENTRPSIFAALRRKETFATSGTRMRIRLFGGWTYEASLLRDPNWTTVAYARGVPMGGDLPARGRGAPRFVVQAVKDPNGANLDRIQIIKVWLENGAYKEKVFDVALSGGRKVDTRTGKAPPVGDTVDLKTATYANTIGAAQLSTVWQDPEFDAAKPAVYYARALEIPTPRWTTLLAVKRGLPLPPDKPATLQERAWSSPIWYSPAAAPKS